MTMALKFVLWGLLGTGLYGGFSVSYQTITGLSPCPNVAGFPACYIVTIGYTLMLLATFMVKVEWDKRCFLLGWTPVFLLAAIGSVLETINGNTCPKNSAGLALCYVSLSFAISAWVLFFLWRKSQRKPSNVIIDQ
ncbi:hypothetical protein OAH87_04125 [Marinomonas sp.]|nr:hypothetical protein [Marinomonas sp.]MDB4837635.1 hypothetical protein [Marinomonas sp.]